jgi:hypothetical protein
MEYIKKPPTIKVFIFKNKDESMKELKSLLGNNVYITKKDPITDETVVEVTSQEGVIRPEPGYFIFKDENKIYAWTEEKFKSVYVPAST